MPNIQWEDYAEEYTTPDVINTTLTKTLDELLEDLDNDINIGKWDV